MAGRAELTVGIKGDASNFNKTITAVQQRTSAFASGQLRNIAGMVAGAFSVGALVSWGRELGKNADTISDLSKQLGMTTDQYQALAAQAVKQGVSTESLNAKLFKLADAQGDVVNGNAKMGEAFARLGVKGDDVFKPMPVLLEKIARGIKDDATAMTDLNEIFGRGAASDMQEVLEDLATKTFPELVKQMKEAGMVLSEDVIAKLAQLQVEWNSLKLQTSTYMAEKAVGAGKRIGALSAFFGAYLTPQQTAEGEWESGQDALTRAMEAYYNRMGERATLPKPKDTSEDLAEMARQREIAAANKELDKIAAADQKKLRDLNVEMNRAIGKITVEAPQSADMMAQRGMFVGGQTSPFLQEAKYQTKVLETIAEYTQRWIDYVTGGE